MIHELIDPKKKTNKTSLLRNTKTYQSNKNFIEYCNFEQSDCENKNTESSSATFIPPWLRNSLGLNQRNILSHTTTGSDQKASKIEKDKESNQNELDFLGRSAEHDCCKEWKDQTDTLTKGCHKNTAIARPEDNTGTITANNEKIPSYHGLKNKEAETKFSWTNVESKAHEKGNLVTVDHDILTLAEIEKVKNDDIKRIKLFKQKQGLKKLMSSDQKSSGLGKSEIDFLLQMKAREVVENIKKKDVHSISSELKNLEAELTVLGAKSPDLSGVKLKQQDIRSLQEIKSQIIEAEEFKRLFEHIKLMTLRDIVKSSEFLLEGKIEKEHKEKEGNIEMKSAGDVVKKCENEGKFNKDQDYLLSTDDEDNIKRFSQFLSKNKNFDEKKKCLEEVRNYFEKKRKLRQSKRHYLEEEKKKGNPKFEKPEENVKEKAKVKNSFKGNKYKYGFSDEAVVKKVVEETLQKFVDMYQTHLTPPVLETMKGKIFQCMPSSYEDRRHCSPVSKKINLKQSNLGGKEPEKNESPSFLEDFDELVKEPEPCKEIKKKNLKALIHSSGEHNSSALKGRSLMENEKFKRLRKEFDNFLNSVQFHIDLTNLKLQSIILEKEEQPASSKNVQFVYNFTKKSLEREKMEFSQSPKESSELKNCKDDETQTTFEIELSKRNVKVQAFVNKFTCEQNLQTEDKNSVTKSTQTNEEQMTVEELKELKSHEVNPGLYRMVKAREAGKFYLYPEQAYNRKQTVSKNSSFFVSNKKLYKKKDILNMLSKGTGKERRFIFKERERNKLKKKRKISKAVVHFEEASAMEDQIRPTKENSVNCLYFRNFHQSNSDLFSPKKGSGFTEENGMGRTGDSEELSLENGIQVSDQNHMGCFLFWDGEKLTPGCDLKTHVENLLKEKLKEMIRFESHNNEIVLNSMGNSKNKNESVKVSRKNAVLSFTGINSRKNENLKADEEEERLDERSTSVEKKNENEETEDALLPLSEEKPMRSVATQNSQDSSTSINLSKLKIQSSKAGFPVKKRNIKQNFVVKPGCRKPVSLKKAESIVKAIEELKRIKLKTENFKNENSRDSESLENYSLSAKESKKEISNSLSVVFHGRGENREVQDLNFKNKLKKLISLVNCEIQRSDIYDVEDVNPVQTQSTESHQHFELIEAVLNRITHKERKILWNDVRDFIKTRISKDINDNDAREVCIEIEQDMPKNDQGKLHDILAKEHCKRNEGDIEVEIDLTLEDLERILRQREKTRKRNLHRSSVSNKYLSTSSVQDEFVKSDFRKYQKYLRNFSASGEGRVSAE